ncbi:MAG: hypothetical protein GY953_37365, partial [bacterium]|nr:hypothetical protein [bacterium]
AAHRPAGDESDALERAQAALDGLIPESPMDTAVKKLGLAHCRALEGLQDLWTRLEEDLLRES